MNALIVEHAKRYCSKKPVCKERPLGKMCKQKSVARHLLSDASNQLSETEDWKLKTGN